MIQYDSKNKKKKENKVLTVLFNIFEYHDSCK